MSFSRSLPLIWRCSKLSQISQHQQLRHLTVSSRTFSVAANPDSKQTLYDILGVKSTAGKSEIKEAFFRRSKELHPDVNPAEAEKASEDFQRLAAAYEVVEQLFSKD